MKRLVLVAVWMCSVVACAGPSDEKPGNGWEFETDAGTDSGGGEDTGGGPDGGGSDQGGGGGDAGHDTGVDVGPPPPSPVTFRLTNGSGQPVFADWSAGTGVPCGGGAFVQVIEDGVSHGLQDDCTQCRCTEAPNCAVCALDCAPGSDPFYSQLSAGEAREFTWDGMFREVRTNEGEPSCIDHRAPTAEELVARFCWGHSFDLVAGSWGEIAEIECQDVRFSPDQALVEFQIQPTAREQVTFTLTNDTNETLYASNGVGSPCEVMQWLTLSQGGQALLLNQWCGDCSCVNLDATMCPLACPAIACAPPLPEAYELPPGGSRTWSWNRAALYSDEVDGLQCVWDRLVVGETNARFCWSRSFDEAGFSPGPAECGDVLFDPFADARVEYRIN